MLEWSRSSWRILRLFIKRALEGGSCLIVMLPQLAQMHYLPVGLLLPHSSVSMGSMYADLLVLDTFERETGQTNGGLRFLESPLSLTCSLLPRIAWLLHLGDLLC